MTGARLRAIALGAWRDHGLVAHDAARRARRALSLLRYRLRARRGESLPPRVVAVPGVRPAAPVAIVDGDLPDTPAPDGGGVLAAGGMEPDGLPAVHVEALAMAAAAEDLDLVAGGWAEPGAPARLGGPGAGAGHLLLRIPESGREAAPQVVGRLLPHVTSAERRAAHVDLELPGCRVVGPYVLRRDVADGRLLSRPVYDLEVALGPLPDVPGGPTVLFLLPFLAVGGAERLLAELVKDLTPEVRCLVVTVEPHRSELGQTVDELRELTPWVFTLGDWLPREALPGALRHLLRRYRVDTLCSFNGTVLFYREAASLRRRFPRLRILHQLFNHEGGWTDHVSPRLVAAVDGHLAVNTRIARALEAVHRVPRERVHLVEHGVEVPPLPAPEERQRRRSEARRRLGLPEDALVTGSFIRLHEQKRPLDVVRLARRFADRGVWFLLVGGGPLDAAVERELAARPAPNLVRLPLQRDVGPLFEALDLCLMTSAYEGLPVFLLEGLARGIPCVATAVGDVPRLLADGGGIAVERPGDLEGLARAVEALADPARRAEEGERGRATVAARFSRAACVARYREVLLP